MTSTEDLIRLKDARIQALEAELSKEKQEVKRLKEEVELHRAKHEVQTQNILTYEDI